MHLLLRMSLTAQRECNKSNGLRKTMYALGINYFYNRLYITSIIKTDSRFDPSMLS